MGNIPSIRRVRWLPAINETGVEIPPFGACKPVEVDSSGRVSLELPDEDSSKFVVFAGPTKIPPNGGIGVCTMDYPTWAKYNTAGTPIVAQEWGTVAGSHALLRNNEGFLIFSDPRTDTSNQPWVMVIQKVCRFD